MANEYKEIESNLLPKITYQPQVRHIQMDSFKNLIEKQYGIKLNDYWELHEWSIKNFPQYWECVWKFYNIIHSQPYTEVFDKSKSFHNMEWFKGARLNYTENIFKYRDEHTALIVADDDNNVEYVTYKMMYEEVCVYAAALKASGIRKGDIVACYTPNRKESIYAFLAAASMGCMFSGALPLLGTKAVLNRFDQIGPKILFSGGSYAYDGKEVNLEEKLPDIIAGLPTLKKVVIIPNKKQDFFDELENIPKCLPLCDFLLKSQAHFNGDVPDLEYEQLPFDYPMTINFTSGTTGKPKALVHSLGSFFAQLKDFGLHKDCTRKDVLLSTSAPGWVTWNMFTNILQLGMTVCVYDGQPYLKSPTHFWDLIDKFGLTTICIWTTLVEMLEKKGYVPNSNHSLKTFRQIFPLGSPMKPQSFDFLSKIKPGLYVAPIYGSTELNGNCCGLNWNLPVYKGEIQAFSLGFDVRCIDEEGNCVIGKRGCLVLANPMPALPICLLNDENKEKYAQQYLKRFPGYWDLGDEAWINPATKGFIVFGRSDETMLTKGARFSCSEIYSALDGFPGLADYVCVSQYNSKMEERIVLFVKMASGHKFNHTLEEKIRQRIAEILSEEHVPNVILETPDIPYNINGKKLNLLVKKLINKQLITNTEVVVNPSSVAFYKNVPQLKDF